MSEEKSPPLLNPILPSAPDFIRALEVDAEVALDIVQTAINEVEEQLAAARCILEKQDEAAWAELLHSLKGAASTLGAMELSEYFRNREEELLKRMKSGLAGLDFTEELGMLQAYLASLQHLGAEIRRLL